MATYALDFAFDVNTYKEQQAVFSLQVALVQVTDPGTGDGKPSWFTGMKSRDEIYFRVWDFSATSKGIVTPKELQIDFLDVQTGATASPSPIVGQQLPLTLSSFFPVKTSQFQSPAFKPVSAGWIVGKNSPPLGEGFTLADVSAPTRYFLQARVMGTDTSNAERFYYLDPEVVIGPYGGGFWRVFWGLLRSGIFRRREPVIARIGA